MQIQCEAISQNRTFCIDKKSIKQLFADYEVNVSFKKGYVVPYKNAKVLPEKSAKYEVAALAVSKPRTWQLGEFNSMSYPLLLFYSVDKKYLTAELKAQFAREVMPKIFDRFLCHKDDDYEENGCEYSMAVYLVNGTFVIEENKRDAF